jgi:hypothetical protein
MAERKKGDTLHVIQHLDGKHLLAARPCSDGAVEIGVCRKIESAADLIPGAELAKHQPDGTWRVEGTIPGGGQVATAAYRQGWDNIFGGRTQVGQS